MTNKYSLLASWQQIDG